MLYLSLFCLNLLYKSLDVYNSGGSVVPNSDVYNYSDPLQFGNLLQGDPSGRSKLLMTFVWELHFI